MNQENTKKLLEDFPNLYKQHNFPMTQTCMCWGFECGDGWFNLIYDLSKKITETDPKCEATQVKEKYGTLRFYVQSDSDEVRALVEEAEEQSAKTCEECGDTKTAHIRDNHGWFTTLCDSCNRQRK